MADADLSAKDWMLIHLLAANLANKRVSKNMVLGLRDYMIAHSSQSPEPYLQGLASLGDTFAGGKDEQRQRETFGLIIRRITNGVEIDDWSLTLSWVARMIVAYRPEPRHGVGREKEVEIQKRIGQQLDETLKQIEAGTYA
ncbi:MAG: hypothetical protein AAF485_12880 [Chloroflexota bacterium]